MKLAKISTLTLLLATSVTEAQEIEFQLSGNVEGQLTAFTEEGRFAGQGYRHSLSLSVEPELYWEWDRGDSSVVFKPFFRVDQRDGERTHADIRELLWTHVGGDWEVQAGLGKVFWGVTEFQHLVDTINQTDAVESLDGEEKLGQSMVNLSFVRDWGIVDAFILPGFRERTFIGEKGRLRPGTLIDTDHAEYESAAGDKHIDLALRWSHTIDVVDVGVHWFRGTNREPVLRTVASSSRLVPYYEQMNQIGIDAQATIDSWLWKFEGLVRDTTSDRYAAAQAGLEYTYYGVFESPADVGVLLEYGWDERGEASTANVQNDLFIGARFTLNNAASTELLIGMGHDIDDHSESFSFEGSHRIGSQWKVSLEGQYFNAKRSTDTLADLAKDSYLQLSLAHYF